MKGLKCHQLVCVIPSFLVLNCCTMDLPDIYIDTGITIDSTSYFVEDKLQNRWIYNQMINDYLWADEMPELSLLDLNDSPQSFFSKLLNKSDRFSWIEINQVYQESSSLFDIFGIELQSYSDREGDTISRLLWVSKASDAYRHGLRRGDWISIINRGVYSLTINTGKLENASFQPVVGPLTLLSTQDQASSVVLDSIYSIDNQKIGYFVYNQFNDTASGLLNRYRNELRSIMAHFKAAQVSELIIDLRYNPGGYVSICQFLSGLLLPDKYLGSISGYHSFNARRAAIQYKKTKKEEEELFFPSKSIIGNDNMELPRLFFLVSKRTASASESLINNLTPFMETILVGTKTTGKGVGSWTIASSMYKWQLQPITFFYYNKNHESVSETGFVPDIYIDDTYNAEIYDLGDTRELLLSAALEKILGGRSLRKVQVAPSLALKSIDDYSFEERSVGGYLMEN